MKVVLTSDGSRTLFCEKAAESYHSESGAYSEARVVYLENSGAMVRLLDGEPTRILEIGLGSGLNFLLAADQAVKVNSQLIYTGIDAFRVPSELVRELGFDVFLEVPRILETWLEFLDDKSSTLWPEFEFVPGVRLHAVFSKAEVAIRNQSGFPDATFDCVFHDAFSPASSEELWTRAFLTELHRVLVSGGTLTTYCVKSIIQQRLRSIGFDVQCLPGPEGGKRQVLLATRV